MSKLLILQHSTETPPGTTPDWCNSRNIPYSVLPAWKTTDWKAEKDLRGIVICGGAMNVDEEDLYPWLGEEKKFIKLCLSKGVKILGLCLGAQLLAEVLGAKVGRHPHWEVGWHMVSLTKHPFLPTGIETIKAFQWHHDSFQIPSGAVLLGQSQACRNQGFAYEQQVLAFQFHPESNKNWIRDCARTPPKTFPQGAYVQNQESILREIQAQDELQKWYWQVLDLFFKGVPQV